MKWTRSPSSSSTPRLRASSMSSTAEAESGSSIGTVGTARAATATSVSRTRVGNRSRRSATMLSRLSGSEMHPAALVDRAVDQCASQLQRVERIAARRVVHADESRPGQVQRQSLGQKPMDRPDRERFEREALERLEGTVEVERYLHGSPADGRENGGRLAVQPPQHEAEHLGRARVHPLHVVECDEQRPPPEQARARQRRSATPSTRASGGGPSGPRSSNAVSSARR